MVPSSTETVASVAVDARTRDFERMRNASDYAIEHMAAHLHAAGQHDRLHTLLVGNAAWMDAKLERLASHAPYVSDLTLARSTYADPLDAESLCRLLELHTARLVLNARVTLDTNIDIEVLTRIGRHREALDIARLRPDPHERFEALALVEEIVRSAGKPQPEILDEMKQAIGLIRTDWQKGFDSAKLAQALRASSYVAEARAVAFRIEYPEGRHQALAALIETAIACGEADREATDALLTNARSEPDAGRRVYALGQTAALFFRMNDQEAGVRAANGCIQTIESAQTSGDRDIGIRDLSISLAHGRRFDDAVAQANLIAEGTQKAIAFRRIAEAILEAGDEDRAIEIVRGIDVARDRHTALLALAQRLIDSGQSASAIPLLLTVEAEAREGDGAGATSVAWCELSVCWDRVGNREDADRCLARAWQRAEAATDGDHALFVVAREMAKAGRFDEARRPFDRLEPKSQRYLLRDIAASMARRGDATGAAAVFADARALAAAIRDPSAVDGVLSEVARAVRRLGRKDVVGRVVALIANEYNRAAEQQALAIDFLAAGQPDNAIATAAAIDDGSKRDTALVALVESLAGADDVARAMTLVRALNSAEIRAKTAGTVVQALLRTDALDQALAFAGEFQNLHDRESPVGALAVSLVKAGRLQDGLGIVQGMEEGRKRWWALRESAEALTAIGRPDHALAVAESIPDLGVREFGFSSIAGQLFAAGKLEQGLALVARMSWTPSRVDITTKAVDTCLRLERFEDARAIALAIPLRVKDYAGTPERHRAVEKVAEAMAKADRTQEASRLLKKIGKLALDRPSDFARNDEAAAQARSLAKADRTDEALAAAARITDERTRGYAELDIVREVTGRDRVTDARAIALRIKSDPERANAFRAISDELVRRGRFAEARQVTAENPGQWEASFALHTITEALASQQRFVEAIDAGGLRAVESILNSVAQWAKPIEATRPGCLLPALVRVLRVARWSGPQWDTLAKAIEDPVDGQCPAPPSTEP